jgi:hypothetical protein
MTDPQDKSNPPDHAHRVDELLNAIHGALAQDAGADARSAGAVACQAILGVLDPTSRASGGAGTPSPMSTSPAATSPIATLLGAFRQLPATASTSTSTSPIAALLGAINQIPREQLLEAIGGLRGLLGQQGPTYLTRPRPPPMRPAGGSGDAS